MALALTHLSGIWRILYSFVSGRPVALLPRIEVDAWVELMVEHRPTVAFVPPPGLGMLLDRGTPEEHSRA